MQLYYINQILLFFQIYKYLENRIVTDPAIGDLLKSKIDFGYATPYKNPLKLC